MFADIVNFTQVAANMSPSQVFAMLNRIFSAFDELAEQYGLEKIKTIGDAYMVAGGLNEEVDDYSAAIADMAIAMRDLLRRDFRSTLRTWKCASASAPARSSPACWARRSSSTTSGATRSTSPAASPPKACPA
jgi:hypothetical protein